MKKRTVVIFAIAILVIGIGAAVFAFKQSGTRKVTFEECEAMGGEAWRVDLYHPDICPACAEYAECLRENSNAITSCPQVMECGRCMESQSPYPDKCPGGKQKIGEISDAAICFQCCK